MNFSHRPRLRLVPISLRRMKSPSEIMPTSLPAASNPGADRNISGGLEPEVIMLEFYEPGAAIVEQSVADAATRFTKANKHALDFMFGAQRAMLEEIVFAGNEMLDRARTETHLLTEF